MRTTDALTLERLHQTTKSQINKFTPKNSYEPHARPTPFHPYCIHCEKYFPVVRRSVLTKLRETLETEAKQLDEGGGRGEAEQRGERCCRGGRAEGGEARGNRGRGRRGRGQLEAVRGKAEAEGRQRTEFVEELCNW